MNKETSTEAEASASLHEFAGMPEDLLGLLHSCRTLPSVPAVVVQVLDLAQDPDSGTAKLAKVIARDPALVAKILKVANSAWCGVRREVTTLDQAVSLLGLNGTMSLALSFSLTRGLKPFRTISFDHQRYWRRSVIAAAASVAAGFMVRAASREELFLAGLLQDIGMLILNEAMPEYGKLTASAVQDHGRLVEIERRELQADHAEVGQWFLHRWGLPDRLVGAIQASHRRDGGGTPLANAIALGSCLADIWMNPDTAAATAAAAEMGESVFHLSQEQMDQILVKTAADVPEMIENLEMAVWDEGLINKLLDQAREAIAEINVRTIRDAQNLVAQAQRDALTSLHNRTYLNEVLENQFTRSIALGQPLTVIFIDIDHFKQINDTHGHHGGDAVLVSVARTIRTAARNYDTVVRFGGDEFVVLLANAGESIGAEIAERIRATVEQQKHNAGEGKTIQATVSAGWATMLPNSQVSSPKELLEAADRSLYAAKAAGRNRVGRAS